MRAYLGADWSGKSVVCASAVGGGAIRGIRGARPSLKEVSDLVARVRQRHPEAECVHVILQSGETGWARLFFEAGAVVHVVDARQSAAFARSLSSSGAKDDRREARDLVELGRSPAHCPPPWEPSEREALGQLGAAYQQVSKEQTKAEQQLRALLRTDMPLVDQQFRNLDAKWVLHFLELYPTMAHLSRMTRAEFEAALQGRWVRARRLASLWAAIQASADAGREFDNVLVEVHALRVRQLVERIRLLENQCRALEAKLDAVTESLVSRQLLESVEGIGLHTACTLLDVAFDGAPLDDRDAAGVRLGACPVFVGSGEDHNGRPKGFAKMRKNTSARGKRASYLLGRFAQQHLPWAAAMYTDGRSRGQSAATAYRRVARSLLRILTAMLRDGIPYDDARYVQALKSRGVPWATIL